MFNLSWQKKLLPISKIMILWLLMFYWLRRAWRTFCTDGYAEKFNFCLCCGRRPWKNLSNVSCSAWRFGHPGHWLSLGLGSENGSSWLLRIKWKLTTCKKDIVSKITVLGQECLCIELFPIDAAIVMGTYASIPMDKEALTVEVLSVAMAAKTAEALLLFQLSPLLKIVR